MLTQNFYSQIGGGNNSNNYRNLYLINTSKTRIKASVGFICRLTSASSSALPLQSSGTDVSAYCYLAVGNTADTGFTLSDTIYADKDLKKFTSNVKAFPIIDKTTSVDQITGVKLTGTIQNTGDSDKQINYIVLQDKENNCNLALKLLDSPVTIKPTETFVIEYTLDNLYPVIPDNV